MRLSESSSRPLPQVAAPLLTVGKSPGVSEPRLAGAVSGLGKQKGFTLIELLISITLVAALSTGMLLAMRTSLLSLEKINSRLQFNRRVMGMQHILTRQIGGLMPVTSDCGSSRIPIFKGEPDSLRLVTSYSMVEGARGYPQFDEFRVVKGETGFQLTVSEHLYTGPASTDPYCGGASVPSTTGPVAIVVADRLASCSFSYREQIPDQLPSDKWLASWDRSELPGAIRIEMTPLDSAPSLLPVMMVTVPIRITRQTRSWYEDAR